VSEANFTTKGINITFVIKKNVLCSVLKPPSATVLQEDIRDEGFVVRDLNFYGCKAG
jgi:hypothetical protein